MGLWLFEFCDGLVWNVLSMFCLYWLLGLNGFIGDLFFICFDCIDG